MKAETIFFATQLKIKGKEIPVVGKSIAQLKDAFFFLAPTTPFNIGNVSIVAVAEILKAGNLKDGGEA